MPKYPIFIPTKGRFKIALTIREFVKSERYTGFTKAGTRIPAEHFKTFKAAINSIDEADLQAPSQPEESEEAPQEIPEEPTEDLEETAM